MGLANAGETPRCGAEIADDAFAPVYDDFTARNDYELWLGAMLPELERYVFGAPGGLTDVGCGTGKSFIPMLERGWRVAACAREPAIDTRLHRRRHFPEVEVLGAFERVGLEWLAVISHSPGGTLQQPASSPPKRTGPQHIPRAAEPSRR